jgi:hypothetical protein
MTIPMNQFKGHDNVVSMPDSYTSEILKLFVDTLRHLKDARVLDVGPVCEDNIMFFAHWIKRHYVCDMFLRLSRELSKEPHAGNVWRHLDYPPRSFDGIHLWDFCDHLDDGQVKRLVELCRLMLQPEGLLMLVAFEKPPSPPQVNSFVIRNDYQLSYRVQSHLNLAWYCRHNRALMSLLPGFNIVKSLRYRNGIREVLLKKPLTSS